MSYFLKDKFVKEISDKDFDDKVVWKLKKKECSAILFYAPWCPHCKAIKGLWQDFAKKAMYVNIYAYDVENNKSHFEKLKYELPYLVKAFPTIIFYTDGQPSSKFAEERKLENLLKQSMIVCKNSKNGKRA